MHNGLEGAASSGRDVTLETRQQRSHNVDTVLLSFPERSDDALRYRVSDFVEHVFVVCAADEELVLDVDEVLAVLDDVDVGVVDGLLVVLDASRPISGRTQDLYFGGDTVGDLVVLLSGRLVGLREQTGIRRRAVLSLHELRTRTEKLSALVHDMTYM